MNFANKDGDENARIQSRVDEKVIESIDDNLEASLLSVTNELRAKGYLNANGAKVDTDAAITIDKVAAPASSRMNDFLKSTVSVKVDQGHGSGVILSKDGYILTNYHVIAGTKGVEIILQDGTNADATIVRSNQDADLALLKINKSGLQPMPIYEGGDPDAGTEVWALGTPMSLELGQSVSKGVISNIKEHAGVKYIQSDVKINPGNSGGALINKEGLLLGVVEAKMIGMGTEGIGFAIHANEIFEKLKLKYK